MESITIPATLDSLARISEFITDATTRVGLDEHGAWQVQLAVDEAATNIIQHGYDQAAPGEIELQWRVEDDRLMVTLRDSGRRFNPDDVPAPDITSPLEERQAGGLGLYLMGQLMDTVEFTFGDPRGNFLTMSKHIPSATTARIFELSGRLDAVSTQQAIEGVYQAIAEGDRQILLDLEHVSFISSSGMRALLLVRKELLAHEGGELRLCSLQPHVREVFELTGFTRVFHIHHTRDEARRAFGRGKREA